MFLLWLWLLACLPVQAEPISIISYNVYFDDISGKERYPKILSLLKQGNYDVIALQECTPDFIRRLKQDPYLSHYTLVRGSPAQGYANVIMTRLEVVSTGDIKIPSKMGRSAPYVKLEKSNAKFISVHLESSSWDTDIRIQQIKTILTASHYSPFTVIAGDFNFGDGEEEEALLTDFNDSGMIDMRVTYDVNQNPLAQKTKFFFEKSRRLDRIIYRCEHCVSEKSNIITEIFSDHWGLSSTIHTEALANIPREFLATSNDDDPEEPYIERVNEVFIEKGKPSTVIDSLDRAINDHINYTEHERNETQALRTFMEKDGYMKFIELPLQERQLFSGKTEKIINSK